MQDADARRVTNENAVAEHLKSNNSNWKNDLSKKLNTSIKEFQNDK